MSKSSPWEEKEYARYLDHERHMFAWCLVAYSGASWEIARVQAEEFYLFESPTEPLRGLVFHAEAWHWAMLRIFGEQYWQTRPELEEASADYEAEWERYEQSTE